ncbi:MAG: serine protein kinase RIO [Candidatus Thermoplasmatota archaeon]|nr:serine protein kinase RIO [Euryarchaeota archaeon]MBU4031193.1 serine protein kinase RIO [Candidatus Thermoplasmatota archaeon]MBU4071197.1 serine protein kinase RIO [Candidatus Thermoplasmatota archaeon]MBU4143475.1 serine protein kinase RIO [Candidatus Thermoplasmatota archaeon]MBU4592748.1 serine protein kinase RIO [Candidatus Thermoplasmatota archaeon]
MRVDDKFLRELESKVLAYRNRDKDSGDRKTYDEVFDRDTLMLLYDLMTNEVIDELDFPIATGKEGNVFRATTHSDNFLAVKIYRMSNATFNNIQKYIAGDERFRNMGKNRRRIIHTWAQKEYRNLERMYAAGIRVPKPIVCTKNIIVMEFIGADGTPALHLRQVELEDPQTVYEQLLENMRLIHCEAKLVHADFSEYNVLMLGQEPVIIDVGQAVLLTHPNAFEFLQRDVKNLARYFRKYDLTLDEKDMMKTITGGK